MIDGKRRYPNGTDLQFPLNEQTVEMIMKHNPEVFNLSYRYDNKWNSDIEVIYFLYK